MGEPVRILASARDLIRLSGYRPGEDIQFEFSGIRPGEKIFEELTYSEEHMARTAHEKIFVSDANHVDACEVAREVDRLVRLAIEGERDTLRDEILRLARNGFSRDERDEAQTPARSAEVPASPIPTPPPTTRRAG